MIDLYSHSDLDGFHHALDKAPEDWGLRLILADWFEEHGDQKTACALRWQCVRKRRPRKNLMFYYSWYDQGYWRSPELAGTGRIYCDPMSDLPRRLFYCVLAADGAMDHSGTNNETSFKTRRLAEEALWHYWPKWSGARRALAKARL